MPEVTQNPLPCLCPDINLFVSGLSKYTNLAPLVLYEIFDWDFGTFAV